MKHIDYKREDRAGLTPAEWLPIGAEIARYANKWADRDDLVTFIGEGATGGHAPALFKPAIAEIEINIEKAFGFGVSPAVIGNLESRATRYEFPRATGAILHEAFHARFSRWSIPKAMEDLAQDEFRALMLLEEGRIERLGLELDSKHRPFFRACAMDLVLGDVSDEQLENLNPASAAQLVGLINARIIAGIFDADEMAEVTQIVRVALGEDAFVRMLEIIDEFHSHRNHYNIEAAYPLAQEWAKIVRDLMKGEEDGGAEEDGNEDGGEGDGEGRGMIPTEVSDLLDILRDIADEIEIANAEELGDQEQQEEWKERVDGKKADAKEQANAKDVANEIFSKDTTEAGGNGCRSILEESRPASAGERRAAVTIARMLEKAKYRDRDVKVENTQIPQGRLRMRAVVQNEGLRAVGALATANEWKRKVRKQTDEPTLNVGVMVDISGSMRSAMQPMATTAWVMSEAVRRVQGRAAMVYYGQDVFPTLKAGQHLGSVDVWTANDPTEKFDKAFKALNGSLNLLNGNGVRLLVVVSDGVYTETETHAAERWMKRCMAEGVAVLWLTFETRSSGYAELICKGTNAVVLSGRLDPADAAVEIGKAAARALEISSLTRAA